MAPTPAATVGWTTSPQRPTAPVRLVLVLAASTALVGGCGSSAPAYSSSPATSETVIDGDARDWPGALRPVPSEAGLSLGLRNTDDALYVAVIAGDERQARRIALGGLRLWLDPAGGTERVLGVRFPAPSAPDPADVRRERARGRAVSGVDEQALRRRFEASRDRVEVTRQDEVVVQSARSGSVEGIETAATWTQAGLVVEVRLPLDATSGLIPGDAGESVGLGVELLDLSRFAPPGRRGRGPVSGGRGAGPPDAGRSDPQREADGVGAEVSTLTRWLNVSLAE